MRVGGGTVSMKFPWNRRPKAEAEDNEELVRLAYRHLLGREPDAGGLAVYRERLNRGELRAGAFLRELVGSAEFRQGIDPESATPEFRHYLDNREATLERALRDCEVLSREDYDRHWRTVFQDEAKLVIGQREYAPQHRERFRELFNAVAVLLREHPRPRLLEFGVSEYSAFYRILFPELALEVSDRPMGDDYIGFNEATSLRVSGAESFRAIDLNRPRSLLDASLDGLRGRYHVLVFAEVLEHLVVNPLELLEGLLSLLAPGGTLYLTTPSFYRRENLVRLGERLNPQPVYPPGEGNWDAHFHHREFCARELLGTIDEAGGRCRAFYYSDCWDKDVTEELPEYERGNMVFAIGRRET